MRKQRWLEKGEMFRMGRMGFVTSPSSFRHLFELAAGKMGRICGLSPGCCGWQNTGIPHEVHWERTFLF